MKILVITLLLLFISPKLTFSNTLTYLYGTTTDKYLSYLENTENGINEVCPDFFEISSTGTLKLTTKIAKTFINELKKQNIKIVPFLSNHWDRELGKKALENREYLSTQIANIISEYELDGINIDIENLTEAERDNYTDFIRLLSEKLPTEKTISVAVAANPNGYQKGWHGSYDYEKLAQYSDYLVLMAYDESYSGSEIGPVASYSFVENSIKYALTHVESEKIVLAIPFYGRFWSSDNTIKGEATSIKNIENLISTYSSNIVYSNKYQSAKATITITKSDTKPVINGITLKAGTYTFWYENETSLKAKIDLMHNYNLKGIGSWRLGQETVSIWNTLNEYIKDTELYDIENHWAKLYIETVFEKSWMIGTAYRTFSPDKNITRAEAITTIVRAFNLSSLKKSETNFDDIQNHWAKEQIETAEKLKIIVGTGNNKFNPNEPITRAEIATILDRMLDISSSKIINGFTDLQKSYWAYPSIVNLTSTKILVGFPDGTFRAKEKMTRAEMATLLTRIEQTELLNL